MNDKNNEEIKKLVTEDKPKDKLAEPNQSDLATDKGIEIVGDKKSKKSKFLSLAIIATLIIAVVLVLDLLIAKPQLIYELSTEKEEVPTKEKIENNLPVDDKIDVSLYHAEYDTSYHNSVGVINGFYNKVISKYPSNKDIKIERMTNTPNVSYKVEGKDYFVSVGNREINVTNLLIGSIDDDNTTDKRKELNELIFEEAKNYLIDNDFADMTNEYKDKNDSLLRLFNNMYISEKVVCGISREYPAFYIDCEDISIFGPIADDVEPFVRLLSNSNPEDDLLLKKSSFTRPQIRTGGTAGYQTAIMGFRNAAQLFYKKDSGSWKYFTGTNIIIECGEYNTVDLKAAFLGDRCYDEIKKDNGTVK